MGRPAFQRPGLIVRGTGSGPASIARYNPTAFGLRAALPALNIAGFLTVLPTSKSLMPRLVEDVRVYLAAVGLVSAFLLLRSIFNPVLGESVPYLQFFPAVMIAAWYGGVGPGLLATFLSALLADFLFLSPRYSLGLSDAGQALSMAFFVAIGATISGLCEALHSSRRQAEDAALELRQLLQERETILLALEQERKRLEALSEQVQTQYEEMAVQAEEMQLQNEELLVQEQQRTNFLAMLAHELRNPLTPIVAAAEILDTRGLTDPNLERQREVIARQAGHLSRMVDDLLDVSRVTLGKIALRPEPVEVAAMVEQALQICQALIEERRHELRVTLPRSTLRVEADPTRLVQILCNLLNNAARYTPAGGRIHLSICNEASNAVIRVTDNGQGIAPEMLPRVFDLFTQADQSAERPHGGLGVGLTLVRSLVEQHGGKVEAKSEGIGKGSELIVSLPALTTTSESEAPLLDPLDAPEGPTRVLVVDDHREAAETLTELLTLWGHDAEAVFGGREAVEALARVRPDLVLMDIGMPGLDGYAAAGKIREHELGRDLTLVAVTGYGQPADRERALACGFDHHVTKPVAPEQLRHLVESHAVLRVSR